MPIHHPLGRLPDEEQVVVGDTWTASSGNKYEYTEAGWVVLECVDEHALLICPYSYRHFPPIFEDHLRQKKDLDLDKIDREPVKRIE